jgi:sulfoacetaldehyde acetyltransferase
MPSGARCWWISRDYFYGELEEDILEPSQYRVAPGGIGNPEQFQAAVEVLKSAKRPVIVSGRGVVDSGAMEVIKALAEHLAAPVACTYLHNDAFPCDHPLWTGPIGYMGSKAAMRILQKADVILAIGTRCPTSAPCPSTTSTTSPRPPRSSRSTSIPGTSPRPIR